MPANQTQGAGWSTSSLPLRPRSITSERARQMSRYVESCPQTCRVTWNPSQQSERNQRRRENSSEWLVLEIPRWWCVFCLARWIRVFKFHLFFFFLNNSKAIILYLHFSTSSLLCAVKWCYCDVSQIVLWVACTLCPHLTDKRMDTHTALLIIITACFTSVFVCCLLPHKDHRERSEAAAPGMIVPHTSRSRWRYKLLDMPGMPKPYCCSPGCREVRAAHMRARSAQ